MIRWITMTGRGYLQRTLDAFSLNWISERSEREREDPWRNVSQNPTGTQMIWRGLRWTCGYEVACRRYKMKQPLGCCSSQAPQPLGLLALRAEACQNWLGSPKRGRLLIPPRCQRTGMCVLHICSRTRVYMLRTLFVDITALGRTGACAQQTGRIKVAPAILAIPEPFWTVRLSTESKRGGGSRLVKQLMMEKLILPLQIWGLHLLPQSPNPLSDKSN